MNKIILFSPLGGTDPIPQTNWRDGSMLHICRHYKPDEVYLYMSAEILELHKADNRYLYCLDKLAAAQNRVMKYHIIERENLKDVQLFDRFYEDFREIITEISKTMGDGDELIINVSSGTPAMKSALLVLATLGEYPVKLVQVTTPLKKMNEHKHEGYDVELLWDGNEDNEENAENRCHEVKCPTLSQIKQEEIIKKLVRVYDYKAALEIAKTLSIDATKKYLPLLEIAKARLNLDLSKLNSLVKTHNVDFIPIKSEEKQKFFEYALNMDIKRKKGEYVDFIRSITPILLDLFILILQNECQINIKDFTTEKNSILKWDKMKLKENNLGIDEVLNNKYIQKGGFRYDNVSSDHIVPIIQEYSSDIKLKKITEKLRKIEEIIRNPVAHQMVSLSDDKIKNRVGINSEEIMTLIKKAFKYTGLQITQKHWDSYDAMNEKIIAAMG